MSKLSRLFVVYFVVVGLCCQRTDSLSPKGDKEHPDDAPNGDDRFHRPSPLDLHKPPSLPSSLMGSTGNDEDDESDEREPPPLTPDKRPFGPRTIARRFSRSANAKHRPPFRAHLGRQRRDWIREKKWPQISSYASRISKSKISPRRRRSLYDDEEEPVGLGGPRSRDGDDDEDENWRELMTGLEDDYEGDPDNHGSRRDEEERRSEPENDSPPPPPSSHRRRPSSPLAEDVERKKQLIVTLLRLESRLRDAEEDERREQEQDNGEGQRRRLRHGEGSASGQRVDEEDDDDEEFENWQELESHDTHSPPPPPIMLFANRPFDSRSRRRPRDRTYGRR